MNRNGIYFEPIPQSKPGNACDSALSSSQPCLSRLPLVLHSFHGEQIGTLSILLISLPGHGSPCLSHEYPWKASWILCFPRHSFARDSVISKYWSGKRTKQADCPNVDTPPQHGGNGQGGKGAMELKFKFPCSIWLWKAKVMLWKVRFKISRIFIC